MSKRPPPPNPKYQHIQAKVDTGPCAPKKSFFPKKKGPGPTLFHHFKPMAFGKLIYAVALDAKCERAKADVAAEATAATEGDESESILPPGMPESSSVLVGFGEVDRQMMRENYFQHSACASRPVVKLPYLLFDVREQYDYEQGHIITAQNYPANFASRAQTETKDMLEYKNKEDKAIIFYGEDCSLAINVATAFGERGYENVYVIDGGLKELKVMFPCGLITTDADKDEFEEDDLAGLREVVAKHAEEKEAKAQASAPKRPTPAPKKKPWK